MENKGFNYNVLILENDTKFEEAIKLLDDNGTGVLPVVDINNQFVGLITDGDIRKSILNKNLDLEHIINKNPYKMNISSTKHQRIQYLKKIQRRQLPIVNENNEFIEIFTFDSLEYNLRDNPVVIMAGGLGSRLGELTKDTPKPMLKIGKKPILELIVENFIAYGFSKFYFSVNYLSHIIKDYFGDGSKFGIEISYIEEEKKLGTAGALSLIEDKIDVPFIVSNGDVLTTIEFDKLLDFHIENNSNATMCVREMIYQVPYGVIKENYNKITEIVEKPTNKFLINAGIYVLSPTVLTKIAYNEYFDMPKLFEKLDNVFCYKIDDYWIDIGQKKDYEKVNLDSQFNYKE
ncbi:nucleotidyl transferase [Malaciobacter mytili]|uniref:nucleotidyltransferase family protein n=1 Tax=Malaciobacter mytili TaxID=603050 RepID=UPI00100A8C16|nr:nucleotidyltransferase family protein [Malaciobacter mytili]RXI36541.1 nucleotidyl transferase [Malaciobacter mytili]